MPTQAISTTTCEGERAHLYIQPLWSAMSTRLDALRGQTSSHEELYQCIKQVSDEDSRLDRALGAGPPVLWRPPPSAGGNGSNNRWRPRGWSQVRRATVEEVRFMEEMGMLDWMDEDRSTKSPDDSSSEEEEGDSSDESDHEEQRARYALKAVREGDDFVSSFIAAVKAGEIQDESEGTGPRTLASSAASLDSSDSNSSLDPESGPDSSEDDEPDVPDSLRGWTLVHLPRHLRSAGVLLSRRAGCKTSAKRGLAILRSGEVVGRDSLPEDKNAPAHFWDDDDELDEIDEQEGEQDKLGAAEAYPQRVETLRAVRRQLAMNKRVSERAEALRRQRQIAGLSQDFEFPDASNGPAEQASSLWDEATNDRGDGGFDWASLSGGGARSSSSSSSESVSGG